MQDLQSIAGSTGRIYIGDRRTRPCPNQTLKCPRCDSLNTKFCYFNNYNLSQPRHFCKSCRRYWTKGGVLRNVPVGGGCRKSKRSKPKHSSDTQIGKTSKSSSNSSSESSTFTAGAVAVVTAEASASSTSAFYPNPNPNSRYETPTLASFDQTTDSVVGVFPDAGNFVDTIAPSTTSMIGFHFSDPSPLRSHYNSQKLTNSEEFKLPDFLDQTVPMDLPPLQSKTNDSEFTVFDWNVNGEQGLFELTGNNDHGFWNQNQWAENDNLLPFRNF